MNCECMNEPETSVAPLVTEVRLPAGLLGFERMKDYLLITRPGEEPFQWLQVKEDPSLAFIVIDPFIAAPDYKPDLPHADAEAIGLKEAGDAVLLNIVTLHKSGQATVNLKGPVVINRHTGVGKQVVIANTTDYSVRHPLPAAEIV